MGYRNPPVSKEWLLERMAFWGGRALSHADAHALRGCVALTFQDLFSLALDADGCCRRAVTSAQTWCSTLAMALPTDEKSTSCTKCTRLAIKQYTRSNSPDG
jgi:hypothetical protein